MEGEPRRGRRPSTRLVASVALVLVSLAAFLVGGWSLLRQHASNAAAAAAVSPPPTPLPSDTPTATPTPTPSPSPTPTATPSPTAAPTPRATAPTPAPPPPGPPPITINVPWYHQQYNLSCEEASLSMVLAYYGHPTTEKQIFDQIGIDLVHYWAGKPGGGDPYVNFVGDPNGSEVQQTGYGVYWTPVRAAAVQFGARVAQAGEGIAPDTIYSAIKAGHPALVWVTFDWQPHTRSDYQAYDGKTVPYAGPEEHAMVVTGINGNSVRVNDPDRSQYWVPFDQFQAAYAVYNQMAIVFG